MLGNFLRNLARETLLKTMEFSTGENTFPQTGERVGGVLDMWIQFAER
jgi:hypothetical protein